MENTTTKPCVECGEPATINDVCELCHDNALDFYPDREYNITGGDNGT